MQNQTKIIMFSLEGFVMVGNELVIFYTYFQFNNNNNKKKTHCIVVCSVINIVNIKHCSQTSNSK